MVSVGLAVGALTFEDSLMVSVGLAVGLLTVEDSKSVSFFAAVTVPVTEMLLKTHYHPHC